MPPIEGVASMFNDKNHGDQLLHAPSIERGSYHTVLPSRNITKNIPYRTVECTCGLIHTRTVGFESFECSNCGRLYIWSDFSSTVPPTYPRS